MKTAPTVCEACEREGHDYGEWEPEEVPCRIAGDLVPTGRWWRPCLRDGCEHVEIDAARDD